MHRKRYAPTTPPLKTYANRSLAFSKIVQMKSDMAKRAERAKIRESKYREMPDIVVRVVCKYRAELYFKISRKTKLSRLFNAWTERMEANEKKGDAKSQSSGGSTTAGPQVNGTSSSSSSLSASAMQFIFSHGGRTLEVDQTPEEAGMEDGDEILAVEIMDLTEGPGTEELVCGVLVFLFVFLNDLVHRTKAVNPADNS